MSCRRVLFLIAGILITVFGLILVAREKNEILKGFKMSAMARVSFPMSVLKSNVQLLDVNNIETVWEYYLLENLSCGLIRDSQAATSGFEGCLAESFFRENERTWVFKLRSNRWSNGEEISEEEIRSWINDLKNENKRHIKLLKLVRSAIYNSDEREIKLKFDFPVDESLLHELSLAEAGLFPISYQSVGWGKTSGPYYVKSWDSLNEKIILGANKYSSFYHDRMLKEIELFRIPPAEKSNVFKSLNVDIVPLNALSSPSTAKIVIPNSPQVWVSHPMVIVTFHLNAENVVARKLENRELFYKVVQEIKEDLNKVVNTPLTMEPEAQLIPKGFSGRLDNISFKESNMMPSVEKTKIRLHSIFQESLDLLELIKHRFLERNISVEFVFSTDPSPILKLDEFAGLYGFAGNQRDSLGSWSFLTSSPNGILSKWKKDIGSIADDAFKESSFVIREEKLKKLHNFVLSNYLTIPLMVGSQRYLFSNNIEMEKWNRFDSRLRLYELNWK